MPLMSLLTLLNFPVSIPDLLNLNLPNLRLSFCPELPNIFSSGSFAASTWATCIFSFVYMLISLLAWAAVILSIIFIVWFGILYITQPEAAQKTHSRLMYALLGLFLSLSAITIINLITMLFLLL